MILCNFEKDVCSWQRQPQNGKYRFERINANQVGDNPGPNVDYEGKNDKYFMLASGTRDDVDNDNQLARFRSPEFDRDKHPVECFSFWFNFGVSSNSLAEGFTK